MHNLKSSKKGQAAMEFLMTYGWAILVVLVVVGALAYFGVLNPQRFIPERCDISVGMACQDLVLGKTATASVISVVNNLGRDIDVLDVSVLSDRSNVAGQRLYQCTDNVATQVLTPGASFTFTLDATPNAPAAIPPVAGDCASPSQTSIGSKLKGTITIRYTDLQTGVTKTETGQFTADIVA